MNEEFELAGVIGEERYPVHFQLAEGNGQVHQSTLGPRTVPMMFKNLPAGTQLFIKKVKDERTNS